MAGTDHGEVLTKFEEIFGSVVEHEVIKLILQNCDWNATAASDTLLAMIDKNDLPPHVLNALTAESLVRNIFSGRTDSKATSYPNAPVEVFGSLPVQESYSQSPVMSAPVNGEVMSMNNSGLASPTSSNTYKGGTGNTEETPSPSFSPLKHAPSGNDAVGYWEQGRSQWVLAPEFVPNALHLNPQANSNNIKTGIWPRGMSSSLLGVAKNTLPQQSKPLQKANLKVTKKEVINRILTGKKFMVLMRGLPGSGKTTVARELNGQKGVILSSDDYFFDKRGNYNYKPANIGKAHEWNKYRAFQKLKEEKTPIIIDNTNLEMWEMEPYVKLALQYGYEVELLEVDSPWKLNPKELARRNIHGVPKSKIADMKQRYQQGLKIETLVAKLQGSHMGVEEQDGMFEDEQEVTSICEEKHKNLQDYAIEDEQEVRLGEEMLFSLLQIKHNYRTSDISNSEEQGDDDDDADVIIEGYEEDRILDIYYEDAATGVQDFVDEAIPVEVSMEIKQNSDILHNNLDIYITAGNNSRETVTLADSLFTLKNDGVDNVSLGSMDNVESKIENGGEDIKFNPCPVIKDVAELQKPFDERLKIQEEPLQISTSCNDSLAAGYTILPETVESVNEKIQRLIEEASSQIDISECETDWDDLTSQAIKGDVSDEKFNDLVSTLGSALRLQFQGEKTSEGMPNNMVTLTLRASDTHDEDSAMYEFCKDMEEKTGKSLSTFLTIMGKSEQFDFPFFDDQNLDSEMASLDTSSFSILSHPDDTGTSPSTSDDKETQNLPVLHVANGEFNTKEIDILVKEESHENIVSEDNPMKPEQDNPMKPEQDHLIQLEQDNPIKLDQDNLIKLEQDNPIKPEQDDPIKPEQHIPIKPEQDNPIKPEPDDPIKPEQYIPIKTEQYNPIKTEQDNPIKTEEDNPIKTEQDNPIKPEQDNPIKPEQDNSIKSEQDDSIKPEQDNPIKSEQDNPIKPDQDNPIKPEQDNPMKSIQFSSIKPEQDNPIQTEQDPVTSNCVEATSIEDKKCNETQTNQCEIVVDNELEISGSSLANNTINSSPTLKNGSDFKELVVCSKSDSVQNNVIQSEIHIGLVSNPISAESMSSWECVDIGACTSSMTWDFEAKMKDKSSDSNSPKPNRSRRTRTGDSSKWLVEDVMEKYPEDASIASWSPVQGNIISWDADQSVQMSGKDGEASIIQEEPQPHTGAVSKYRRQKKNTLSLLATSIGSGQSEEATQENAHCISSHTDSPNTNVILPVVQIDAETQTLSIDFEALQLDNNLYELKVMYGKPNYSPKVCASQFLNNGPLTKGKLKLEKGMMTENTDNVTLVKPFGNLVAFFPNIPEEDLRDVFEKCKYDLDWAMNVLLDGGYEMSDPSEDSIKQDETGCEDIETESTTETTSTGDGRNDHSVADISDLITEERTWRVKQSQQPRDLAAKKEIEQCFSLSESVDDRVMRLTGKENAKLNMTKVKKTKKIKHGGRKNTLPKNEKLLEESASEGEGGAQYITLVMDPLFASQLSRMFGPVGSSEFGGELTPDDCNVILPLEFCHTMHQYWKLTLDGKFRQEAQVLDSLIREDECLARRLQEEENAGANLESSPKHNIDEGFQIDPPTQLQEIMDLEQALQQSQQGSTAGELSISTKLNLQRLYTEYPHVDPVALREEFGRSGYSYQATVENLTQRFGSEQGIPKTVIAPEALYRYEKQMVEQEYRNSLAQQEEEEEEEECAEQDTNQLLPDDPQVYRDEAQLHYYQRQEAYKKAQDASRQGMKAVAAYYARIGNLHAAKLTEANQRASQKILEATNASQQDANCLDLHLLHVPEALSATKRFLGERTRVLTARGMKQMQVSLITGRGAHSLGGQARVKPAIKDFLLKSGYLFHEANVGMFTVTLCL